MRIAIIPARGGSRRIPRKNIRDFLGKPIIAYSIRAARGCGLFGWVLVSTEDAEIADVALAARATVIWREGAAAEDAIGTQEVVARVLSQLPDDACTLACCIYATAPLISHADLQAGHDALLKGHYSFAMSVGTEPLRDAGQFYWGTRGAFLGRLPLISPATAMIPISESRVCDINTEADWQEAIKRYKMLNA